MTNTAIINLRILAAINIAAATKEPRYYMNGVYVTIEPTHVTYVATDGHIFAAYQDPIVEGQGENTLCGSWIIPQPFCASLTPKGKIVEGREIATLEQADLCMNLKNSIGAIRTFAPVDGTFPDWRWAIPKEYSGEVGHFNLELLARADKIVQTFATILRGVKSSNAYVVYNGNDPALFGNCEIPKLFGIIMPWRQDHNPKLPEWFKAG